MRRHHLGRRIEFYSHTKYGGHIPIYLDQAGTFTAVIGDVELQANTKAQVIKLTVDSLKAQSDLKWIGLIEISFGSRYRWQDDDEEGHNKSNFDIELQYERYWIAQKIDKHWVKASWDVTHYPAYGKKVTEVGDRLERSNRFQEITRYNRITHETEDITDFTLPYIKKPEERDETPIYYIEYNEDLWLALKSITTRMKDLQIKIIEVLKTPESRAMLIADVSRLLPEVAGQKPKARHK
jgi:hypothetical protein